MKFSRHGFKSNEINQKYDSYWPLHNGIVLERHKIRDKSKGGILIPESAQKTNENTVEDDLAYRVLKVGPEITNVKVGDFVFTSMDSQYVLYLEDGPSKENLYYQIFEQWVLGVIREGAELEDFKPSPAIVELSTKGLKRG